MVWGFIRGQGYITFEMTLRQFREGDINMVWVHPEVIIASKITSKASLILQGGEDVNIY